MKIPRRFFFDELMKFGGLFLSSSPNNNGEILCFHDCVTHGSCIKSIMMLKLTFFHFYNFKCIICFFILVQCSFVDVTKFTLDNSFSILVFFLYRKKCGLCLTVDILDIFDRFPLFKMFPCLL